MSWYGTVVLSFSNVDFGVTQLFVRLRKVKGKGKHGFV